MSKVMKESKLRSHFLVADIETIMNEKDQHVPYAIGFMHVIAGHLRMIEVGGIVRTF